MLERESMVQRLQASASDWDIIIIGGGATGLGCAIDAASRGYRTALLEAADFARGTSSRSTKLVHGGVRYLQQGNVSLVLEALKERGLLRQNAPHLVGDLPFIVPNYDWWEAPFYGIGLRLYDVLAGKLGFGPSRNLSKAETLEHLPTIETEGLRGGVIYHDGQFDDARLAIDMAATAATLGATLVNYAPVVSLRKEADMVDGRRRPRRRVGQRDRAHGSRRRQRHRSLHRRRTPARRRLDAVPMIRPSQGVHIVLDRSFLPGKSAIMVPHTDDGRVLFAIPWHGRVIVGTTDTPLDAVPDEPRPPAGRDRLPDRARGTLPDEGPDARGRAFRLRGRPASRERRLGGEHRRHLAGSHPPHLTLRSRHHRRRQVDDLSQNGRGHDRPGRDRRRPRGEALGDEDAAPARLPPERFALRRARHLRLGCARGRGPSPRRPRLRGAAPRATDAASGRGRLGGARRRWPAPSKTSSRGGPARSSWTLVRASEAAPRVAELMAKELGRDEAWQREQVEAYGALARTYLPG